MHSLTLQTVLVSRRMCNGACDRWPFLVEICVQIVRFLSERQRLLPALLCGGISVRTSASCFASHSLHLNYGRTDEKRVIPSLSSRLISPCREPFCQCSVRGESPSACAFYPGGRVAANQRGEVRIDTMLSLRTALRGWPTVSGRQCRLSGGWPQIVQENCCYDIE